MKKQLTGWVFYLTHYKKWSFDEAIDAAVSIVQMCRTRRGLSCDGLPSLALELTRAQNAAANG